MISYYGFNFDRKSTLCIENLQDKLKTSQNSFKIASSDELEKVLQAVLKVFKDSRQEF